MHTNFNNEDIMGCNSVVGQCLHANYDIRRPKCTFYTQVYLFIGLAQEWPSEPSVSGDNAYAYT